MANCNAQDLMEVSACWSCLDPRQTMAATLAVLCEILQSLNPMAQCDVQSIMQSASCWSCLSGNQPMMAMLQLLCEILQAGGGGVCVFCEEYDPNINPPSSCTCSQWINTKTAELWYWRSLTSEWIKYISNT